MIIDVVLVHMRSVTPYSQSRPISTEKLADETHRDHEERCWRERMHTGSDGFVQIPPMAFKNGLSTAAQHLGMKIPGQGSAKYTKRFERGILALDPVVLKVRAADVKPEPLFVPSDGVRGGSSRVWKNFPIIPEWEGVVLITILDLIIARPVFEQTMEAFATFVGLGRFRPERNGYYGRFEVLKYEWEKKKDPRGAKELKAAAAIVEAAGTDDEDE